MKEETTITFFASECGEFHGMGECIECTSLKEAFRHYQRFCKRFPHMVPSLEFSLHHADDPLYNEGEYPLATGEKGKELLSYVPYYANHPLVQEAVKELEQLREMRGTIQGCTYGEKIGTNPNRNLEAPFIKTIEKIWEYEQKIDAKINRLVDLRAAINAAIESMENPEERLLLKYRYLKNESWEDISYDLNVSYRTVHRIHASALNNFVVPE